MVPIKRFIALAFLLYACPTLAHTPAGFTSLFDGRTLNGWILVGGSGPGYIVRDGAIVCPKDGGGDLLTEREYSDFIFRFEYRLQPGGNNGIGLRTPLGGGNLSYIGMESQVLDDYAAMYRDLKPWQFHGSIYGIVPADPGAPRKAGQWNSEEITFEGRHVKIRVNGKSTIDADLNNVHDGSVLLTHPGMLRDRGHIGFLGHGPEEVEFRNIWIKEFPVREKDNTPPKGFAALFNGRDLAGWKGLVADPPHRAKMTADQLAAEQGTFDKQMRDHWTVIDGALHYDGKGNSLCTAKDYGDFEMLVDWKIKAGGDSGIYLRGSPQVQIWDRAEGSGGLYNNQKNPSNPTKKADKPVGEWNRFRILMIGEKVTVFLNDELIFNNVTMENYWERDKPIYPTGQIELQHHGDELWFKNIYIREIPRT